MAKTKLLAEISAQSDEINKKLSAALSKLAGATALNATHWDGLSAIKTDLDKLDQTISKLEARIKTWDGSTKLRDIFKKKAPLAKARQDTIDKVRAIKKDAEEIKVLVQGVIEEMQHVGRSAAH